LSANDPKRTFQLFDDLVGSDYIRRARLPRGGVGPKLPPRLRRLPGLLANIPEAARRLQIAITPHSVVAKRTADRTAKINDAISEAIDSPDHDCD
jgi:hypothetical protein